MDIDRGMITPRPPLPQALSPTSTPTFAGLTLNPGPLVVNGITSIQVPDQTNFFGTLIFGSLLTHLTHNSGTDGQYNTFVGIGAGGSNTTGFANNAFGTNALIAITSGNSNMALGSAALLDCTIGSSNMAIGKSSCQSIISGSENVGIGTFSLLFNQAGSGNVAIGTSSGGAGGSGANDIYYNTLIGEQSGLNLTTGSGNVCLGAFTGNTLKTGGYNILLGYNIQATAVGTWNELNIGGVLFGDLAALRIGIGRIPVANELEIAGAISTNLNVAWDLGAVTVGAVTPDTLNYVAVTIGGVPYKLIKAA